MKTLSRASRCPGLSAPQPVSGDYYLEIKGLRGQVNWLAGQANFLACFPLVISAACRLRTTI
jgi:hypothetical protein